MVEVFVMNCVFRFCLVAFLGCCWFWSGLVQDDVQSIGATNGSGVYIAYLSI